jgi:hypothetical protein
MRFEPYTDAYVASYPYLTINRGTSVQLAGTLELQIDSLSLELFSVLNRPVQIFGWNGQLAPGEHFDRIVTQPGYVWDTNQLYTEGIVTLTAVPEPTTIVPALCAAAASVVANWRRRRIA